MNTGRDGVPAAWVPADRHDVHGSLYPYNYHSCSGNIYDNYFD